MTEPTAALTFQDLILNVAERLGVAYYGPAGNQAAQIPDATTMPYELDRCKRFVQDGIRMFINDAPTRGWRWQRPSESIVLWADVAEDADVTVTGIENAGITTLTATGGTPFYPSMEGATISIDGIGDFVILAYISSTVVTVTGDATCAGNMFSIASNGTFALPSNFDGEVAGDITFAPGSNLGTSIVWVPELATRRFRENWHDTTGTPHSAAVQRRSNSRRWDLVVYPTPGETVTVVFPYVIYFDKIVDLTATHPAGFAHDEAVKAASLAQAELQGEDVLAGSMEYYRKVALPNSYRIDDRAAPRRIGYCGNPRSVSVSLKDFRNFTRRPTVPYSF